MGTQWQSDVAASVQQAVLVVMTCDGEARRAGQMLGLRKDPIQFPDDWALSLSPSFAMVTWIPDVHVSSDSQVFLVWFVKFSRKRRSFETYSGWGTGVAHDAERDLQQFLESVKYQLL